MYVYILLDYKYYTLSIINIHVYICKLFKLK